MYSASHIYNTRAAYTAIKNDSIKLQPQAIDRVLLDAITSSRGGEVGFISNTKQTNSSTDSKASVMAIDTDPLEDTTRTMQANLKYLLDGPKINQRFISAGVKVNTGRYSPYEITICDSRDIKDHFLFNHYGFQLLSTLTKVADFHNKTEIKAKY